MLCLPVVACAPSQDSLFEAFETTRLCALLRLRALEESCCIEVSESIADRTRAPDAAALQQICLQSLPVSLAGAVLVCSSGHFLHATAAQPLRVITLAKAQKCLAHGTLLIYVDVRANWIARALLRTHTSTDWTGSCRSNMRDACFCAVSPATSPLPDELHSRLQIGACFRRHPTIPVRVVGGAGDGGDWANCAPQTHRTPVCGGAASWSNMPACVQQHVLAFAAAPPDVFRLAPVSATTRQILLHESTLAGLSHCFTYCACRRLCANQICLALSYQGMQIASAINLNRYVPAALHRLRCTVKNSGT